MEVYNAISEMFNLLQDDELRIAIVWLLLVQLVFFVAFFYSAIHIFRKPSDKCEFSSSFYVIKKRYGINVMEDPPYDC